MSGRRLVQLLIAAALAMALALVVNWRRNASQDADGSEAGGSTAGVLLPSLQGDLNTVTAVTLIKGGTKPVVTLTKGAGGWTVAERGDYPADSVKLRKLLLELRDARIVEEKTADPARFAVIGVQDPGDAAGSGTEVMVSAAKIGTGLIVGKAIGSGNFVRRVGENRTFAVEPAITLETEPRYWIEARLLDVPVAMIQSVEVKPATGPQYTVRRVNPADNSYSLEGLPAGRKALDGHALAPSQSMLSGLNADDVAQADAINFSSASQVMLTLTDGNVITLTGTVLGDKHWIQIKATKDAALMQKAAGRAYEVPSYRYDAIFRPLDQLLEPLPQKAAPLPAKAGGPPKAGGPVKPPPLKAGSPAAAQ